VDDSGAVPSMVHSDELLIALISADPSDESFEFFPDGSKLSVTADVLSAVLSAVSAEDTADVLSEVPEEQAVSIDKVIAEAMKADRIFFIFICNQTFLVFVIYINIYYGDCQLVLLVYR
jgi:hypothetical protein